jgi:hypothetical protein
MRRERELDVELVVAHFALREVARASVSVLRSTREFERRRGSRERVGVRLAAGRCDLAFGLVELRQHVGEALLPVRHRVVAVALREPRAFAVSPVKKHR